MLYCCCVSVNLELESKRCSMNSDEGSKTMEVIDATRGFFLIWQIAIRIGCSKSPVVRILEKMKKTRAVVGRI